jgi:hypoxanthine phosphoribosyltransferase
MTEPATPGAGGLRPLIAADTIATRVGELAAAISADHAASHEVLLVGVLKGAFVFLADLARQLTIPNTIDFVAVSSYGDGTRSSGSVRLILDTRQAIEGRHVILVEDIVDTGRTVAYLHRLLKARNPATLQVCTLLYKPGHAVVEVAVDYWGFEIPDVWVVGYGLDLADRFRTLPYIAAIEDVPAGRP